MIARYARQHFWRLLADHFHFFGSGLALSFQNHDQRGQFFVGHGLDLTAQLVEMFSIFRFDAMSLSVCGSPSGLIVSGATMLQKISVVVDLRDFGNLCAAWETGIGIQLTVVKFDTKMQTTVSAFSEPEQAVKRLLISQRWRPVLAGRVLALRITRAGTLFADY